MRGTRITGVSALVVALLAGSLVAVAPPAAAAGHEVPKPGASYLPGKFAQATVDRVVRDLARVGIGVYEPGEAKPLARVQAPVSPMRLTDEQARNVALGAWAHSGLSGLDIDALMPVDPALQATMPPTSAILAAYVKASPTPAARLARLVMGRQDWKSFQDVVFPSMVLVLFESDLAVKAGATAAPATTSAPSGSRLGKSVAARVGACSLVLDFVNGTIEAVFAAIPRIKAPDAAKVEGIFGRFFGRIINVAVRLAAGLVNGLIEGARILVVNGVKLLVQPVLDVIAEVAAVVATVASVVTTLQHWTGRIKPNPYPTRKAIGDERPVPGEFTLTVETAGVSFDEWPVDIADCAQRAGVTLPPLRPQDATVIWDVHTQTPEGLVTTTSPETTTLAKDSTAKLAFATTAEPADVAKTGSVQYGAVTAVAIVKRDNLEQVRDKLMNLLFAQIPVVIEPVVGPPLRALLAPKINAALERITSLQNVKIEGVEYVRYHEPKPEKKKKKKPTPGGTTRPPAARSACDLVTNAEVVQVLGVDVGRVEPSSDQFSDSCIKGTPRVEEDPRAVSAYVAVSFFKDRNAGEAFCASFPQPVEGIGDRATFLQLDPVEGFSPAGFLCAVAGEAIVTVSIYRYGELIPLDQHVKLMRKALGRVG